ncbi:hypothetical protein RRG08_043410 [Elysia crispata]|uniref:Uncharacterized protein n=1 Tax=Elysia crispata TaxID=231223 RepID=A0AAE1ATM4_9GAST|nr:hypothetical protein RRG08_043410 [Elysia crispata]
MCPQRYIFLLQPARTLITRDILSLAVLFGTKKKKISVCSVGKGRVSEMSWDSFLAGERKNVGACVCTALQPTGVLLFN